MRRPAAPTSGFFWGFSAPGLQEGACLHFARASDRALPCWPLSPPSLRCIRLSLLSAFLPVPVGSSTPKFFASPSPLFLLDENAHQTAPARALCVTRGSVLFARPPSVASRPLVCRAKRTGESARQEPGAVIQPPGNPPPHCTPTRLICRRCCPLACPVAPRPIAALAVAQERDGRRAATALFEVPASGWGGFL